MRGDSSILELLLSISCEALHLISSISKEAMFVHVGVGAGRGEGRQAWGGRARSNYYCAQSTLEFIVSAECIRSQMCDALPDKKLASVDL